MQYEVEYTDEFEKWWLTLSESEQESVSAVVELVAVEGPRFVSLFLVA